MNESSINKNQLREQLRLTRKLVPDVSGDDKKNPSLSSVLVRSSRCLPSRDEDIDEWSMPSIPTDPKRTLGLVLADEPDEAKIPDEEATSNDGKHQDLMTTLEEDGRQAQEEQTSSKQSSPMNDRDSCSSSVYSQDVWRQNDLLMTKGSSTDEEELVLPLQLPKLEHDVASAPHGSRTSELGTQPASLVSDRLLDEPKRPELPPAKSKNLLLDGRCDSQENEDTEVNTTSENNESRGLAVPQKNVSAINGQEDPLAPLGAWHQRDPAIHSESSSDEEEAVAMPLRTQQLRQHFSSMPRMKRTSQLLTRPPSLVLDRPQEEPERPGLPTAKSNDSLLDGRYSSPEKDAEGAHGTNHLEITGQVVHGGVGHQSSSEKCQKASFDEEEDSIPLQMPSLRQHVSSPTPRMKRTSQLLTRPPSLVLDKPQEEPERPGLPSAKSNDSLLDGRYSSNDEDDDDMNASPSTSDSPIHAIDQANHDDGFDPDDEQADLPVLQRMASPRAQPKRTSQLLTRPASLVRVVEGVEPDPQNLMSPRTSDELIDGRSFDSVDDPPPPELQSSESLPQELLEEATPTFLRSSVSMPVGSSDSVSHLPLTQHTSPAMVRPKRTSVLLTRPASLVRVVKEEEEPQAPSISTAKPSDVLVDGREEGSPPKNQDEAKCEDELSSDSFTLPANLMSSESSPRPGAHAITSPAARSAKGRRSAAASLGSLTGLSQAPTRAASDASTASSASVNNRLNRRSRKSRSPVPQRNSSQTSAPGAVSVSGPVPRNAKARRSTMLDAGDTAPRNPSITPSIPIEVMAGGTGHQDEATFEDELSSNSFALPGNLISSQSSPRPGAHSITSPTIRNAKARRSAATNLGSMTGLSVPSQMGSDGGSISTASVNSRRNRRQSRSPKRNSAPAVVVSSSPVPRNAKARRSAMLDTGDPAALTPPGALGVTGPVPRNAKARRGGSASLDTGDVRALSPPGAGGAAGAVPRNAKGRRSAMQGRNVVLDEAEFDSSPSDSEGKGGSASLQLAPGGLAEAPSAIESLHATPGALSVDTMSGEMVLRSSPRNLRSSRKLAVDSGDTRARPPRMTSLPEGGTTAHRGLDRGHVSMPRIASVDDDELVPGAYAVSQSEGFSRRVPDIEDGETGDTGDSAVDNLSVAAIPGFGVGAQHITNTDTVSNTARFNSSLRTSYVPPAHVLDGSARRANDQDLAMLEEESVNKKGRRNPLIILLGLLLLGGIGVAVAIPLSSSKLPPTGAPLVEETPSPTAAPSYAPTSLARFTDFMDLVEPVSSMELLSDKSSPQRAALEWLAHRDPAKIDPRGARDVTEIRERYLAAVLYYALGGDEWLEQSSFLSGRSICAWNNGLEGVGIACEDGSLVTTIKLERNGLRGSIPPEICSFTYLEQLSLSGNEVNGDVPLELGNCKKLKVLNLEQNNLERQVPSEIVNLTNLRILGLSANKLTGTFPSPLLSLPRLEELYFGSCRLQGNLPSELSTLTRLTVLDVGSNMLEGTLPTELGLMTDMILIDFGNNWMEGTLPTSLGSLTNLIYLEAHNNDFTGVVPSQLENLLFLETLTLHNNRLAGDIDPIVCDRANPISDLQADCFSNTPIQCSCCTDCL